MFRRLIGAYGLRWTAKIPQSAWDEMARVNEVLSPDDKRAIARGEEIR